MEIKMLKTKVNAIHDQLASMENMKKIGMLSQAMLKMA